jgi:ABC-2 type transport system permease protein
MGNVLNIARKEFSDFVGSKFILVVTLIFLITFGINLYLIVSNYGNNNPAGYLLGYSQYRLQQGLSSTALLSTVQDALCEIMLSFGGVVALLMGYLAISNERRNNALTTIITKPLFRDTIINGKFLGAIAFLVLFFAFISAVYTIGVIIIIGEAFNPIAYAYLASMPVIIALALLCVMIYYSVSILVSIFIKNDMLALFVSVLVWLIFTQELSSWDIAMYIAAFSGQSQLAIITTIMKICPNSLVSLSILSYNDTLNVGLVNSVMANSTSVIALAIYTFILVMASYSLFLRRDIL